MIPQVRPLRGYHTVESNVWLAAYRTARWWCPRLQRSNRISTKGSGVD